MANKSYILEQRIGDLATLLLWDGELSRRSVKALLGVQDIQASRILGAFRAAHPELVAWDSKSKVYLAANPEKLHRIAGSLLDYLRLTGDGDDGWLVDARHDLTHVEPEVLAAVRTAIRSRTGVEVVYCSMTRPEGIRRTVFPHAVARTARRCHIRAWDTDRKAYRDFNLGRIRSAFGTQEKAPAIADEIWAKMVGISLVPHRGLSVAQQRVVRDELFQGAAALKLKSRAALVPYAIQDLQAATHPTKQLPPDYQLELSNVTELKDLLISAMERG